MAKLNDAVLLKYGSITRVVTLTQCGRAVVEAGYSFDVESDAGSWPVVGHFEQHGRFWKSWIFIPNSNEKGN